MTPRAKGRAWLLSENGPHCASRIIIYTNCMGAHHTANRFEGAAVIGAGVIGCAIAYRLAASGRSVLLLDPAEPGLGGGSYGNAGRIGVELVEPIPSAELVFGFWRDLFAFGGIMDIPASRLPAFAPWALGFAAAGFRRRAKTEALAPLVRDAAERWEALLAEIGASDLLARRGHYHFWLEGDVAAKAEANARAFAEVGVASEAAPQEALADLRAMSGKEAVSGLFFPESAHVLDPGQICTILAEAAIARGATFKKAVVKSARPLADGKAELALDGESLIADEIVICAGPRSTTLLAPFGVKTHIEAARGYHVELPNGPDRFGISAIFMDTHLVVTPMAGRLRASSFLEFAAPDAPGDPRKPARLVKALEALGYECEGAQPWHGARGMLPDTLPGIGRIPGAHRVFYAIGGQMIGLTIAAKVAEIMRELVETGASQAGAAFDLKRFA